MCTLTGYRKCRVYMWINDWKWWNLRSPLYVICHHNTYVANFHKVWNIKKWHILNPPVNKGMRQNHILYRIFRLWKLKVWGLKEGFLEKMVLERRSSLDWRKDTETGTYVDKCQGNARNLGHQQHRLVTASKDTT